MQTKIMIKSFLVNLSLTMLKLLGAFFSNSKTLMGDAIHCLSDMATDIIGLIGSKLANKKPNKTHPFGYGKIEYLTCTMVSIFIMSLGIGILYTSFNGSLQITSGYALIIVIISIIIKFILSGYLLKKGKELNSNILITNGTESRYDSYCSVLALIFVSLSLLGSKNKLFLYADLLGGIVTCILTLKIGISLFLENINALLDEIDLDEEKINNIKTTITKFKKINEIKDIKLLKYGSYYNAQIELEIDGSLTLNEIHKLKNKIKKELRENNIELRYITINAVPIN